MATDYLTCGQCLREFPLQRITLFIQHKKLDCDDEDDLQCHDPELKCNYCPQGFMTAWALLVHAQLTHNLKIFLEKASKSFLNDQVKFSSITKEDYSDEVTEDCAISTRDKIYETKDFLTKNDGTSLSPERDQPDKQFTPVKQTQSTGSGPGQGKMGSGILVTRNILTGLKEVEEKTEASQANIEKNIKRNSDAQVSASSQICSSQKIILPINQATVSFVPKVNVEPLTVSSCPVKTSSIKLIPNVLTGPLTQTSPAPNVRTNTSVVTVLQKETPTISSIDSIDNQTSENQTKTHESPTIILPKKVTVPSPSVTRIAQLGNRSTEVLENRESVENASVVTPVSSKPNESLKSSMIVPTALLDEAGSQSLQIDENVNDQGNIDTVEMTTSTECCDSQGCGVTVIPGSHENLQECCNAVLPKKRKRHMELKHMPFSWSSSRYARRKRTMTSSLARSTSTLSKPSTGTIYIDLEPDTLNSEERPGDNHGGTAFKVTQSVTSGVKIQGTRDTSVKTAVASANQSKPHSLILQPGAIFSIPFTYKIPTSKSLLNTVALPIAKGAVSLVESGQQTGPITATVNLAKVSNTHGNQSPSGAHGLLRGQAASENSEISVERGRQDPGSSSKPFKCDKCSMAFNQRIHLKKHMSKHTGIKPYKCGECSYSTVERSHLKVHIRIHTGEKPFKCTYCEYATAQNSTLKIHLKRHHGGKMFQCQTCNKKFTQEDQLKGHKSEHGPLTISSAEQKASDGSSITTSQQTSSVAKSQPLIQTSSPSQNSPQVRYTSIEEVLVIQTTNQQQNCSQLDIKEEANQ